MAEHVVNGVDVRELGQAIHRFRHDPELARFRFRARNRWLARGGRSHTTIDEFTGAGEDHRSAHRPFELDADEPEILLGRDEGPNPVEHLLNALVTCLTGAMVYHAAARGIRIEELESELEGEIDLRGFLGISEDVRKGYQRIHVTFHVKSDAPADRLRELCEFSPVFDVVRHGTAVDIDVDTRPAAARSAEEAAPTVH
jgi:uncharacterized OsmC-like protein